MPAADVHGSGLAPKGMPRTKRERRPEPVGPATSSEGPENGPVGPDTLGEGEALGGAVVGEEIAVAGERL